MDQGQKLFHDFYMRLVAEGNEEEAEVLLKEGFDKQEKGEFNKEYLESVEDKYYSLIRQEEKESLREAITNFSKKF